MAVTVTAEIAADIYNRWDQLDLGFLCNPETGKLEGVNLATEFGKWFMVELYKLESERTARIVNAGRNHG